LGRAGQVKTVPDGNESGERFLASLGMTMLFFN